MSGRSSYNLSSYGSRNGWMMRRENTSLHAPTSPPPPTAHRQLPSTSPSPHPEARITQHQGQAIDDPWPVFSYEDRVGEPVFPFRRVPTATHSGVQVFELGNDLVRPYPRRLPLPPSPQLVSFSRNAPVLPADSSAESTLNQDEQKEALSRLRKDTYNPLLSRRMSTKSDYQARDWAILSRQTELGKDNEHGQRCAICLEDFRIKEVVTLTPCNHMFHDDCIVPWVKSHGKCPVCRFAIINAGGERRERVPAMAVGNNPGRERREGAAMVLGNTQSGNYATTTLVRGSPPTYEFSGYGLGPRNTLTFMQGNINDRLFEREMVSLVRVMEAAFEWDVVRPSLN